VSEFDDRTHANIDVVLEEVCYHADELGRRKINLIEFTFEQSRRSSARSVPGSSTIRQESAFIILREFKRASDLVGKAVVLSDGKAEVIEKCSSMSCTGCVLR
jgi:hypothetical protein